MSWQTRTCTYPFRRAGTGTVELKFTPGAQRTKPQPPRRQQHTFESKPYKPSPSPSQTSSSPAPWKGLALGAAFALTWTAGRAYEKSKSLNNDYDRVDKFKTPRYGGRGEVVKAIEEIKDALGEQSVLEKEGGVVVYPKSTGDVVEMAKICQRYKIPMSSGGNSNRAYGGGVKVDFSHMTHIIAVNEQDKTITVQPGVTTTQLTTFLASTGAIFPVEAKTVGDMVARGAGGVRECVVGMTVVLADGTVVNTSTRDGKEVGKGEGYGYDLNALFVGSEGTLGVVCEVVLRLTHIPKAGSRAESKRNEVVKGDEGEKEALDVMRSVKLALDPYWLMNPGRIFEVPVVRGRVWMWQK